MKERRQLSTRIPTRVNPPLSLRCLMGLVVKSRSTASEGEATLVTANATPIRESGRQEHS